MVSQNNLKERNYETIEDFFNYILQSHTNGQNAQTVKLIKQLSAKQKFEFNHWLGSGEHHVEKQIGFKNLLIEILLKTI